MNANPLISGRGTQAATVRTLRGGEVTEREDVLAVEEPLEIRVRGDDGTAQRVAVQMRTPGHDHELAVGLLFAEGIIRPERLRQVAHCDAEGDTIQVVVRGEIPPLPNRHALTSSACGVCGKASIDEVMATVRQPAGGLAAGPSVSFEALQQLPDTLRAAQPVFATTGGLHAAALFSPDGALLLLREDVGRHNAMDKVVGCKVLEGAPPLRDQVILFSGRLGFELVQKAAVAGLTFLAAVGAPSSLAVQLATSMGMTIVGFLRGSRANVYCGAQRITASGG